MPVRTAYPGTQAVGDVLTSANFTKLPGGWIGYAEVTANQAGIGTGGADLTGLTVTVTVGTSRRIKVTGFVRAWSQTVANARIAFRVQESTTILNEVVVEGSPVAGNAGDGNQVVWVATPTSGSHTYKLTAGVLDTGTTTMNAAATYPAFILVEDIGPAS
jgi:hypothetical protein